MANLFYMPFRPAYDSAGISIPGAKAYFTLTGTNTASAPFSNAGLTTPRTNPVIAGSSGKFPTTYLDPAKTYRVRIYSKNATVGVDTPLEEFEPYTPGLVDAGALTPIAEAAAASATAASTSAGAAASSASTATVSAAAAAADADAADASYDAIAAAIAGGDLEGANISVATRLLLAAADTSAGLPAILTEAGRQGIFVWNSSNLSAKVTSDPAQGVYVAPASAPTGASGAWVRMFNGTIDPRWFGIVLDWDGATGTDNIVALDALTDFLVANAQADESGRLAASRVEWPIGQGYSSDTWVVDGATFDHRGAGGSPFGGIGTRLVFAADKTCIYLGLTAAMSIFENFSVHSLGGAGNPDAHGFHANTRCSLKYMRLTGMQGHCVFLEGDSAPGVGIGNVNGFNVEWIWGSECGGDVLNIFGANANNGYAAHIFGVGGVDGNCVTTDTAIGNLFVHLEAAGCGGSYHDVNGNSLWIQPYVEADTPTPIFGGSSLVFGGIFGSGDPTTGVLVRAALSFFDIQKMVVELRLENNGHTVLYNNPGYLGDAGTTLGISYHDNALGYVIYGGGTTNDFTLANRTLQTVIANPHGTQRTEFGGAARLASYTVAGVPSAATNGAGSMIYVSNETGGAVPAFSDGTNWRRVTDRAIIS